MKTLLRIVIILALAVGIAGVTYLAVNASNSGTSGQVTSGNGARPPAEARSIPGNGQPPAGFQRGGDFHGGAGERNGTSNFSAGETLKNIGICAGFILAVVVIEQLARSARRKKLQPVRIKIDPPGIKE